jgi:hypothetical protein
MRKEAPVQWKHIEIQETYVKRGDTVYWKWRFSGQRRWNYRKTGFTDIPFVILRMPHGLVYPPAYNREVRDE